MASGAQFVKIYNVDKTTGNIMKLSDLYGQDTDYIDTISELSNLEIYFSTMSKCITLAFVLYSVPPDPALRRSISEVVYFSNHFSTIVTIALYV